MAEHRPRVAGVGLAKFQTPSKSADYCEMAEVAIRAALRDARVNLADVEQVYAGYVYGDSTSGQNALYGSGMTGVPVVNVNNNCSTGSTALYLARQAVAGGAADGLLSPAGECAEGISPREQRRLASRRNHNCRHAQEEGLCNGLHWQMAPRLRAGTDAQCPGVRLLLRSSGGSVESTTSLSGRHPPIRERTGDLRRVADGAGDGGGPAGHRCAGRRAACRRSRRRSRRSASRCPT
jgi:hypothetical protein